MYVHKKCSLRLLKKKVCVNVQLRKELNNPRDSRAIAFDCKVL